jgi:hypothetical protein
VLFDFDSTALKPDASGDLVAEVIVLAEGRRASIRRHTDSRGATRTTRTCRTQLPLPMRTREANRRVEVVLFD